MKWEMRKIDLLEYRKAKIICKDGTILTGEGQCICDASEGDGQDIEGILFLTDEGKYETLTEDEIERIEFL
ncbi:MAG: hypothetical protein K2H01_04690 [Ruminococcus sp.]|nr:hypothetical protein [Ruminococcus sp.]